MIMYKYKSFGHSFSVIVLLIEALLCIILTTFFWIESSDAYLLYDFALINFLTYWTGGGG